MFRWEAAAYTLLEFQNKRDSYKVNAMSRFPAKLILKLTTFGGVFHLTNCIICTHSLMFTKMGMTVVIRIVFILAEHGCHWQ